ncbi:MAG TPA: Uma2 family endonuclease [Thermoanaerobaculia bacterium]|jgi:Uma2 family endonuclease|nr:Uma2 family endonuclease [Thermoanaerobaculia bacterium]
MTISDVEIRNWKPTDEVGVHRFTREEYEQMDFGPDRRVELLDGVIYDMSPHRGPHAKGVAKANQTLITAFGLEYHVRPQLPLALGSHSMPEPDLAVIAGKPDDYEDHPSEAVLIVEVTDTSQVHDRKRKAKQYARAGIADYWIMNLRLDAVEVLRDPQGALYRTRLVFHRGETISPLARPEISIAVDDLLPRKGAAVA